MHTDYQAVLPTPFGAVGVKMAGDLLASIDLLHVPLEEKPPENAATSAICLQLQRYLQEPGMRFELPCMPRGTVFQQKVWDAIRRIPAGETRTYAALAKEIGSGPRAVANACGANPFPLMIPCHRVVASNGLGGFMQGRDARSLSIKKWLLAHERGQSGAAR